MAAKCKKPRNSNTCRRSKRKTSENKAEESGITQVDLKQYEFFPPGPMGWTAKEYEKLIETLQKKEG